MDLSQLVSTYEGSKVPEFIRAIFYGAPGGGKTTLASTFPKPFFIDADKGMASVTIDLPKISIDKAQSDPYGLIVQVLEDAKLKRGIFAEGGMAYGTQTLVFDSLTTIGELLLAQIMRANKKDPLVDKPGFDEWGVFQRKMIEFASRVKDLSAFYNIIETAWETIRENEDTKVVSAYPMLPGSYRERAGGDVDELYYMEARKGTDGLEVTLHAAPKGVYNAKTRVLADLKIVDPSYDKLLASMKKKRENAMAAKK
jgi:hypothetical protein